MRRWLAIFLGLLPLALYAESGTYRVEVLVFNHLDGGAEPLEVDTLRAFPRGLPLDGPNLEHHFADPVRLEVMSDLMEDAWRRLMLSSAYRPLLFLTWEQSRIDFHPPVRVHGEEAIAEHPRFPGGLAWIDLRSSDPFAGYREPYYRLDGTVQMRRSRFLHLDIDLEYRVELIPLAAPLPLSAEAAALAAEAPAAAPVPRAGPGPARVHPLRQSRQIRTGQLQYFDTPYLGVLARVTATAGE